MTMIPDFESDERFKIYVSVIDQGIGLSQNEVENVFKLNWRSKKEASLNLNPHGNGLGLFICQKICKGLGGAMRVQSEVNIGTTVDFSITAYTTHPNTERTLTPKGLEVPSRSRLNTLPLANLPRLIGETFL